MPLRRLAEALLVAALAGCAGTAPAPPRLLALPLAAPAAAPAVAPGEPWQLLEPVRLPAYLDREALMLPRADGSLLASEQQRWAEPLRDAVPRLLRADLAAWRGGTRTWGAPLPQGLVVARRLRVEVLQMDLLPGRNAVRLSATWTLEDPRGAQAPREGTITLTAEGESVLAAHRRALWQLAGAMAAPAP